MANTVAQLKLAVAGFLQRDPAVFVRAGEPKVDLLLQACNNARLYAERKVDFELSKVDVNIPNVTLSDGADISTAVLRSDNTTPVRVKKIITPFLPFDSQGSFPVDLVMRKTWNDRLKRRYEGAKPIDRVDMAFLTEAPFCVLLEGSMIYVVPADSTAFSSTTFTVAASVIRWLDAYETGEETDFLLDNCFDWMMFYCIMQMGYYMKEDERVQLNSAMVSDAWDSLVNWNNELVRSTVDDTNLD